MADKMHFIAVTDVAYCVSCTVMRVSAKRHLSLLSHK